MSLSQETAVATKSDVEEIRPRRLAVNFLLLTAGEMVAKLLTFAAFTYLARVLHPGRYGSLEFTLAVMVFFALPVDFGLGAYGAREIARNKARAVALFREITAMRLILAICSLATLFLFIALIHKSAEVKLLLTFYGFSLLAGPILLQWFFQAHDQMHWVALASITRQLVFSGLVFLVVRPETPLVYLGFIECASVVGVGAFCVFILRTRMGVAFRRPVFHPVLLFRHIREAFPIGLTELAWAFMWYFATVLLGFLFADESLGWFGASHRILMALHTFVWLYFFNLLPSISRCVPRPVEQLLGLMERSIRLASWTSMFVAFNLAILAEEALVIVYGPEFRGAARSFSILVWMLPVAMLSGHYRYALIAYNLQTRLLYCTAIAAAVAVLLGLTLVPLFSEKGAAWALLFANGLNFALVYFSVRKRIVGIPFHSQFVEALCATLVAAGVFYSFPHSNVWVAAVVAAASYGSVMWILQGRRLRSVWKRTLRSLSAGAALKTPPPRPVRH